MTNQEAIKIVEDIGFYVPLLDSQREALNQLIKTAKKYDEFDELCTRIGGHGGYMISAEDMRTALEKNS